ncbi:MAG: A/G-specific adenine glycosylase [Chloroflexi bacterium]|nr:A/G-specific adenine glycosylase [Chloroflexota bacterium]MCY4246446.1 A/G-specific adenine glycosylase [Chloroflexota bacterium]
MPAPFCEQLLGWFAEHGADLPWRNDPKPYHIWLSEIMLQQTRRETAIPYYQRFLRACPSIEALAAKPLDDVLKLWEGLGYYSRARNLHRAAKIVVCQYAGELPQTAEALQKLPGIGAYTAGAIASIAFGQAAPVLDGNIMRIFTRLLDMDDDITKSASKRKLWQTARDWLPDENVGDYNQALMQLGQLVCRPRNPLCASCPLAQHCRARSAGTVAQRPVRARRAPLPHFHVAAGLIRDDRQRLLITQRPLDGLLGGLWEFPGGKCEAGESLRGCLLRELREELAIVVETGECLAVVEHAFTHFRITLHAFECRYVGPLPPHTEPQKLGVRDWAWARTDDLSRYSFGKADRMVIAQLG